MTEMGQSGRFTLPQVWLSKLQETFDSRRVDDMAMCEALRKGFQEYSYLSDPHTAVALSAAWDVYAGHIQKRPVAVLATASPCKFEVAITTALGTSQWNAYVGSDAFPAAGRAVLAARERPFPTFKARSGDLCSTQTAWEQAVREMLESSGS